MANPEVRPEADSLEQRRAAQGEGWQWPRIQREACPQCGDNPSALDPPALGARAVELADEWREFLEQSDNGWLRANPESDIFVFSPLQYGAHVRDILKVYGDRIVLAIEEDSPTVPIFNPPQEVFEGYNQLDPEALATDLEAQARRLSELLDGMDSQSWSRIVVNDRGVYGVYTFTVAGLACNAVHEAHHHLLDARGMLDAAAAS